MDARTSELTAVSPPHVEIRRQDYRPPDWRVPEIRLDFQLDLTKTNVRATLNVERNGEHERPLRLDGDGLTPLKVMVDGEDADWSMDGATLVIAPTANAATVETEVEIDPSANTQLSGLYASGGMLCTQCEAEGFRRITFFPDRPDVLSRYRVRMEADKGRFPVLLTNGNPMATGPAEGGRHWAEWDDPFPKPGYLFALVAGDLKANHDVFTTSSGRTVDLNIWVREGDLPRTQHAMESLKLAMAWDEKVYGREYDLDLFNIVAVSDFNMGAMENKGLNIFNTRYILADAETATDADFDAISAVVAHEYFHNWSGNRVTCRDWFQLSLKEGFTVFRDQSFSGDIGSDAVKRIQDVKMLRAVQFPEDQGPLAHPVRPDSYIEISNFYTATIYNKGAEVIRMMAEVLGVEKFRKGTDLYFARHDGEAATCDDFVAALSDASGVDLEPFKIWYSQAGTPNIDAGLDYDATAATATLKLGQRIKPTPGQPVKEPMPIPLKTALIGAESGREIAAERLILLDTPTAEVTFEDVGERPLLSINRGFSAPVIVYAEREAGDLEALAGSDTDPFARYEALQELMLRTIIGRAEGEAIDFAAVVGAVAATLQSNSLDPAFKAEAIILPSEASIADRMEQIDPDAIHFARDALRAAIGTEVGDALRAEQSITTDAADLSSEAKGRRKLRTAALGYLAAADPEDGAALAKCQFDLARSMTDREGALAVLASLGAPERDEALDAFYQRFEADMLVIDKWFTLQALAQRPGTVDDVERLMLHPAFTLTNPNRARAVLGAFGVNQWAFNESSGRGYRVMADAILSLDPINPQIAARLITPFGRWRRFDQARCEKMRTELQRIVATPGLSKDVFEQASKSLA